MGRAARSIEGLFDGAANLCRSKCTFCLIPPSQRQLTQHREHPSTRLTCPPPHSCDRSCDNSSRTAGGGASRLDAGEKPLCGGSQRPSGPYAYAYGPNRAEPSPTIMRLQEH